MATKAVTSLRGLLMLLLDNLGADGTSRYGFRIPEPRL